MNEPIDELDALRKDWQHGASRPPEVTVASLRRRLSRGWLVAALEALGLIAACALLTVVALDTHGLMGWIYWGFFTVFFLIMATISVRLRLRTLFRDDDSGQAVLDQARRDAGARRTGGAVVLWTCPVVWLFASLWLVADGLLQGMSASAIAGESWPSFAFVTSWCLMAAALGAWLREKGHRQLLELDQLVREFDG